jgi:hypothetical protein
MDIPSDVILKFASQIAIIKLLIFWMALCLTASAVFLFQRNYPKPFIFTFPFIAYFAFTAVSDNLTTQALAQDAKFDAARVHKAKVIGINPFERRGPTIKLALDQGGEFFFNANSCKDFLIPEIGAKIDLEHSSDGDFRLKGCKFSDQLGVFDRRYQFL